MLTCKDASHLISQSQDRHLGFFERLGLRLHVWICINCRRFEHQIGLIRRALLQSEQPAESGPEDTRLAHDARERIRKSLGEQK
jgi:predicted anti-sigma-YlaC factor YlaD